MRKGKYISGAILTIGIIATAYFKFYAASNKLWIDQFGVEVNIKRDSLNLPLLNEEWITHHFDSTQIFWAALQKGVTTAEPMHLNKAIQFEEGRPTYEIDDFHYEADNDTISYRLVCKYSYNDNTTSFRFIEYFFFQDKWPPTKGYPVNHSFADSIFAAWGFENYYDPSSTEENAPITPEELTMQ